MHLIPVAASFRIQFKRTPELFSRFLYIWSHFFHLATSPSLPLVSLLSKQSSGQTPRPSVGRSLAQSIGVTLSRSARRRGVGFHCGLERGLPEISRRRNKACLKTKEPNSKPNDSELRVVPCLPEAATVTLCTTDARSQAGFGLVFVNATCLRFCACSVGCFVVDQTQ